VKYFLSRNRDFTDKYRLQESYFQDCGMVGWLDGWDQLCSAEVKGSNKVALGKFIKVGWVEFSKFNGFDVKDGNHT
jgi:hypothetical protein